MDFDDKATMAWGSFSTTVVYVDANSVASTSLLKGYKKYCYIYSVQNPNDNAGYCQNNLASNLMDNGYVYKIWREEGIKYLYGWRYGYGGCTMEFAPGFDGNRYVYPSCPMSGSDVWYKP